MVITLFLDLMAYYQVVKVIGDIFASLLDGTKSGNTKEQETGRTGRGRVEKGREWGVEGCSRKALEDDRQQGVAMG